MKSQNYSYIRFFCVLALIVLSCAYLCGSWAYAEQEVYTNAAQGLLHDVPIDEASEVVSQRTTNSKTFLNPNGTFTFVGSISPIHYETKDASLKEIDTRIVDCHVDGFDFCMTENAWQVYFNQHFSPKPVLKYQYDTSWVTLQPGALAWLSADGEKQEIIADPNKRAGAFAQDNMIYYPDAYGEGCTMRFSLTPQKIMKELVVASRECLSEPVNIARTDASLLSLHFSFNYSSDLEVWVNDTICDTSGTDVTVSDAIYFKRNGTTVFRWERPFFHDSSEANRSSGSFKLAISQGKASHTARIAVLVPRAWLDNAIYPIYIDPTFSAQPNGANGVDTMLNTFRTSEASGSSSQMLVRTGGGQKGVVKFDLSSIPAAAQCVSATLAIYFTTPETGNNFIEVYELLSANDGWVEGVYEWPATAGQSTWDHKQDFNGGGDVNWAGSAGCSTADTDYNSASIRTSGSANNPAAGDPLDLSLSTTAVQDWFGPTNENYGILLFGGTLDGSVAGFASSDSGTASERPKLVVKYKGSDAVTAEGIYIEGARLE